MSQLRRRYDLEFRAGAVRIVRETGRSVAQVARDLGVNENTNGLLRHYFPKGTDLSRWTAEEINAVAHTLNTRPRKTLGWRTPAEALNEHLCSLQQPGVATTG